MLDVSQSAEDRYLLCLDMYGMLVLLVFNYYC